MHRPPPLLNPKGKVGVKGGEPRVKTRGNRRGRFPRGGGCYPALQPLRGAFGAGWARARHRASSPSKRREYSDDLKTVVLSYRF
eukprot:4966188-Pyramimonas_sp.AAC.1